VYADAVESGHRVESGGPELDQKWTRFESGDAVRNVAGCSSIAQSVTDPDGFYFDMKFYEK
jgi:hypothetical protein